VVGIPPRRSLRGSLDEHSGDIEWIGRAVTTDFVDPVHQSQLVSRETGTGWSFA